MGAVLDSWQQYFDDVQVTCARDVVSEEVKLAMAKDKSTENAQGNYQFQSGN